MSRILTKLRSRKVEEVKERFKTKKLEVLTEKQVENAFRGVRPDKPLFLDKECYEPIAESMRYDWFKQHFRGLGHTRGFCLLATQIDCYIIVMNERERDRVKDEIMKISLDNIKPTFVQRLLIKIGF